MRLDPALQHGTIRYWSQSVTVDCWWQFVNVIWNAQEYEAEKRARRYSNLNIYFFVLTFVLLFMFWKYQSLRVYARCTLSKPATRNTQPALSIRFADTTGNS